jgi:hypothetical protein
MSAHRTTDHPPALPHEVASWRRARLLGAGFPALVAAELAEDARVDLHAVLELIDRGCPPVLAARILAPLESDRRRW